MEERGIEQLDFICFTGDAYIDHPTFGIAIISRMIEAAGFPVGIIAQPLCDADYMKLGKPKYCFMVTGGNIDSMVSNYTVALKKRNDDAYSPGGKGGRRPDRALTVYCQNLKRLYPDVEISIGGLEASLRRFAHYDYWTDSVMPSVLVSSGADYLMYGMGEVTLTQMLNNFKAGLHLRDMHDLRGICYLTEPENTPIGAVQCDSFEIVRDNKKAYAKPCRKQYDEQDEVYGRTIVQRHGDKMLVQNPPALSLTQDELDAVYRLPYQRRPHPMYDSRGGVPGIEEVQFSIAHNRGCFGYCNFCSIALHQGRRVQTRSEDSVYEEAVKLSENPRFKGYIHDVGGPTANFRHPSCEKQEKYGMCKGKKCLAPTPCKNLIADHSDYIHLLRRLRSIKRVKKIFIRSGIRFDYMLQDKNNDFLDELVQYHVSGQLKVAPEHISNAVLSRLGKPSVEVYNSFVKAYKDMNKKIGKEQYLVPYLMSSHPGSTLKEAIELAEYLRDLGYMPEQVQDFYPTPSTISTCMYYTGLDPATLKPVYVTTNPHEKAMQRALIQYRNPKNYDLVHEALVKAGREDLIGFDKKCLIKPRKMHADGGWDKKTSKSDKNSNSSYGSGKNAGVRKNLKNATERGKNGSGSNTAGTAHKKKTIRNVHKKKR